jgi:putative membrane protein
MVADTYLWTKLVHILAVISWMAGLFYLPRLFVYHADQAPGCATSETFKLMERRLLKAIMRPAALVSLSTGALLWWQAGFSLAEGWLSIKLAAVVAVVAFHGLLEWCVIAFARDGRPYSSRRFRILNEVPTVLLIVIVAMVVLKPWQ